MTFFDQNQRIVGGVVANANSWPAQVFITACSNGQCGLCGGTLIDLQTVLSAAHCVANSNYTYTAYLGLQDNSPIFDQSLTLPPEVLVVEIPSSNVKIVN